MIMRIERYRSEKYKDKSKNRQPQALRRRVRYFGSRVGAQIAQRKPRVLPRTIMSSAARSHQPNSPSAIEYERCRVANVLDGATVIHRLSRTRSRTSTLKAAGRIYK